MIRDESAGVFFEFFQENTIFGNLGFGLAISRAGNAESDGAGSTVSGEADDTDVMRKIFPAKLGTYPNITGGFKEPAFEFGVAESLAVFVPCRGKFVEVAGRCEFDGFKAGFCRGPADHESEVIRWAG